MTFVRTITWLSQVLQANPEHQRESRDVVEYEFGAASTATPSGPTFDRTHKEGKRIFRGDYQQRGLYAGDWVTVASVEYDTFDNDWNGYTFAQVIAASALEDLGGKLVRLSLRGGPDATRVAEMWIGHAAASGHAYDFAADPVPKQVRVGGANSFRVGQDALVLTDPIDFTIEANRDLVLTAYFADDDVALLNLGSLAATPVAGWQNYYFLGNQAARLVRDEFSTNYAASFIEKIEVFG